MSTKTHPTEREVPWLSDALQAPARRAKTLGLFLSHYNSGSRYNQYNGIRIHETADHRGYADFFNTPHLAHVRSLRELNTWLKGRESGNAQEPTLLTAAQSLTVLGTTPDGGIIIGPVGWDALQRALAEIDRTD